MAESRMLAATLKALRAKRGQFRAIAKATRLEYDWLTKLSQGRIHDPGVRKIEVLHDYLIDGRSPGDNDSVTVASAVGT